MIEKLNNYIIYSLCNYKNKLINNLLNIKFIKFYI